MASSIRLFFFNDTATTEIYTLSLHDALPIWTSCAGATSSVPRLGRPSFRSLHRGGRPKRGDRKSTRLNSSHQIISYAVFCLKKKKREHTLRGMPDIVLPPDLPYPVPKHTEEI